MKKWQTNFTHLKSNKEAKVTGKEEKQTNNLAFSFKLNVWWFCNTEKYLNLFEVIIIKIEINSKITKYNSVTISLSNQIELLIIADIN